MKSSMGPIKEEVLDEIDHDDLPNHFFEGRKIMKPKSQTISIHKNKQRIENKLIYDYIFY